MSKNNNVKRVKRNLKRRYATAIKRANRENLLLEQARARRNYWFKIAVSIEQRLDLLNEGQVEMNFIKELKNECN